MSVIRGHAGPGSPPAAVVTVLYVLLSRSVNDASANGLEERERTGGEAEDGGERGVSEAEAEGVHSQRRARTRCSVSRSQTCAALRSHPPKCSAGPVTVPHPQPCTPDGLRCRFCIFWVSRKSETQPFCAHVRALTVTRWMSGLKHLVDPSVREYDRRELDGCTSRVGLPKSGLFSRLYPHSPHGFSKLSGLFRRREAQPRCHRPGDDLGRL